jgi:hypothetical protein
MKGTFVSFPCLSSIIPVAIVLIVALPTSSATSVSTAKFLPPYSTAAFLPNSTILRSGCARAASGPINWNNTTGVGGLEIRSRASSCQSPTMKNATNSSGASLVLAEIDLLLPIPSTGGVNGGVAVVWNLTAILSQAVHVMNKTCPPKATLGYCFAFSGFSLAVSSVVTDLTNNSSYRQRNLLWSYSTFTDWDTSNFQNPFSGHSTDESKTVHLRALVAVPFNIIHRYVLQTIVLAQVSTEIGGWSGSADARIQMDGTVGSATLKDVRVW